MTLRCYAPPVAGNERHLLGIFEGPHSRGRVYMEATSSFRIWRPHSRDLVQVRLKTFWTFWPKNKANKEKFGERKKNLFSSAVFRRQPSPKNPRVEAHVCGVQLRPTYSFGNEILTLVRTICPALEEKLAKVFFFIICIFPKFDAEYISELPWRHWCLKCV